MTMKMKVFICSFVIVFILFFTASGIILRNGMDAATDPVVLSQYQDMLPEFVNPQFAVSREDQNAMAIIVLNSSLSDWAITEEKQFNLLHLFQRIFRTIIRKRG